MTYREVFDTLTLMTIIVLTITVVIQGKHLRSLSRTEQSAANIVQSINRSWTFHAWLVHDVAAKAGLELPEPPFPRPEFKLPREHMS